MTELEAREITRLAVAVEAQGRDLAEARGDIKAIRQWTSDRKQTCDRHEREIADLQVQVGNQRDRVTAGLTRQALVAGLISAAIVGLAVAVPLWLKLSAIVGG